MISGVDVTADGAAHVLRLSARAMMRLEAEFGKPIDAVFADLEKNPLVTSVLQILAAVMADGRGAEMEDAADLVDALGFERAGKILQDVAEKAFPEPAGSPRGKGKRAAGRG